MPEKIYYKIGEVCDITEVPSHVLRFWEKQFPQLAPNKTQSGHRLYKKRDIQTVLQIKNLLYDRKFTIRGAREFLAASAPGALPPPAPIEPGARLGRLKEGLLRLSSILQRPAPFDR
jgi:DNA-binding transcriptional MerR regulator